MSNPNNPFHPEIPTSCPPVEAEPPDQVFKAVLAYPPSAADFVSDIESGKSGAKATNCKHWGCSVWQSEEAVIHGRSIYDHFRKSYIVQGDLEPTDGKILTTPSKKQPQHSTFWKVYKRDISGKFMKFMDPEIVLIQDPFQSETE